MVWSAAAAMDAIDSTPESTREILDMRNVWQRTLRESIADRCLIHGESRYCRRLKNRFSPVGVKTYGSGLPGTSAQVMGPAGNSEACRRTPPPLIVRVIMTSPVAGFCEILRRGKGSTCIDDTSATSCRLNTTSELVVPL